MQQTATVVLEGPNGRNRVETNVISVTTREDGTIDIRKEDEPELVEVGWDWTIRDMFLGEDVTVREGCWVTYFNDGRVDDGEVVGVHGDEITVKQEPELNSVVIDEKQIFNSSV